MTGRVQAQQELREQRDRAHHIASHDPLTGLPNRAAFKRAAGAVLDGLAGEESAAVLFIDLNRFKSVNDAHGHDVGDEVLCAAADALQRVLGPGAILARHAGDEFVAIIRARNGQLAETRAGAAAAQLTTCVLEHDAAGAITASVGWVTAHADDRRSLTALISEADASMYHHKRTHRRAA